ncbi:hypothetical protein HOY80DRAFT_523109 [Tuber brumale]|nr:hypothetical protein HOY80DRAFT_523109 [Tuber brumale]
MRMPAPSFPLFVNLLYLGGRGGTLRQNTTSETSPVYSRLSEPLQSRIEIGSHLENNLIGHELRRPGAEEKRIRHKRTSSWNGDRATSLMMKILEDTPCINHYPFAEFGPHLLDTEYFFEMFPKMGVLVKWSCLLGGGVIMHIVGRTTLSILDDLWKVCIACKSFYIAFYTVRHTPA